MVDKKDDLNRINYKPDLNWYSNRMYTIVDSSSDEFKKFIPSETKVNASLLKQKFLDLNKKAKKLDDAIDSISTAYKIPINKEKQPKVSQAANRLDSASGGEYVSYELYKRLSLKLEEGSKNLSVDWLTENMTSDNQANSDLIYSRYGLSSSMLPGTVSSDGGAFSGLYEDIKNESIRTAVEMWSDDVLVKSVLDFANCFLAKTTDSSYIPWNFKTDVRRKLSDYENIDSFLSRYTDLVKDISDSSKLIPNSPLDLARNFFESLDGKADDDNNFFDSINDILGFNYTADLVCCFVGWSHGLDTKTLEAIRILLSIAANGLTIDYGKLLNTLMAIINNIFKNVIGPQILSILDTIFQMIADPIREWLNTEDETWKRIFLCTPIDELINEYVLGGIEYLRGMIEKKFLEWIKQMEIEAEFEGSKTLKFEKNKKLDLLIKLIDTVIDAIGKLSYCGLGSSPASNVAFMDDFKVNISPSWEYTYPTEENPNKYNSFTKQITTLEEQRDEESGAIEVFEKKEIVIVNGISTGAFEIKKEKIDECLKKISDTDIFSVKKWMEDMISNPSEEMNV